MEGVFFFNFEFGIVLGSRNGSIGFFCFVGRVFLVIRGW